MTRWLVPGVGFLLGLVGGFGVCTVLDARSPGSGTGVDQVTDSAGTAAADTAAMILAEGDEALLPGSEGGEPPVVNPVTADTVGAPSDAEDPAEEVSTSEPAQNSPAVEEPPAEDVVEDLGLKYQKLAQIFMAMDPGQAALAMEQLQDDEIEGILLAMSGRNAAPILEEMDPLRVAEISRQLLGRGGAR